MTSGHPILAFWAMAGVIAAVGTADVWAGAETP